MTQDITPETCFLVLFCIAGMIGLAVWFAEIKSRNEE